MAERSLALPAFARRFLGAALFAACVAAALCAADPESSQGAAAQPPPPTPEQLESLAFWKSFLAAPAQPKTWAASASDTPATADQKRLLSGGFGQLLATARWEAGAKGLEVRAIDDSDTSHILFARYTLGKTLYIGMVSPVQTKPFRVFFPDKGGIYEALINRYTGFDRGAGVILPPGQPYFLAVYPYAVTGMSLDVEPTAARPGASVRVRARVTGSAPAETHLVKFRCVSPEGQDTAGMGRFVAAEKGEALFEVALPAGLAPGKYSLSARCVVTAAIAGATLTVEP